MKRFRRKSRYRISPAYHQSGCILVCWVVFLIFLVGAIFIGNMGGIIAACSVGIMLSIMSLSESVRRRV